MTKIQSDECLSCQKTLFYFYIICKLFKYHVYIEIRQIEMLSIVNWTTWHGNIIVVEDQPEGEEAVDRKFGGQFAVDASGVGQLGSCGRDTTNTRQRHQEAKVHDEGTHGDHPAER